MMISGLGLGHKKEGLRVHACVISFTDAHDVLGREFREQFDNCFRRFSSPGARGSVQGLRPRPWTEPQDSRNDESTRQTAP